MTKFLERYGDFAAKNYGLVIVLFLAFTLIMGVGASKLTIETDFEKMLPDDLPSVVNTNLLRDKFSEPDAYFILVSLDEDTAYDNRIVDIRDPELMQDIHKLIEILRKKPEIVSVSGPSDIIFQSIGRIPDDEETINNILSSSPLISEDYSTTAIFISAQTGNDDQTVLDFVAEVEGEIDSVGFPGSVLLTVTGSPLIQTTIFSLLTQDLIRTMSLAGLIILIILILAYRSPIKGGYAVLLLLLSIIWTGGAMKFLNIPLTIITVMVAALIIGIGIDYTIHVINRYKEERKKKAKIDKAAGIAVRHVGGAIIGTSVTTIISFMSMAAAGIPMMTQMGIALSLGIFFAMIASLFLLPAVLAVDERLSPAIRRFLYD